MEQLEGGFTIYGPSTTLAIWNMGLKFITISSSASGFMQNVEEVLRNKQNKIEHPWGQSQPQTRNRFELCT